MRSEGDIEHLEAIWAFLIRRWRRVLLTSAGLLLFVPYGCGCATGALITHLVSS